MSSTKTMTRTKSTTSPLYSPATYLFTCSIESLAGSTLTKIGSTLSFRCASTRSTAAPILSSSSGQISGQLVNPK